MPVELADGAVTAAVDSVCSVGSEEVMEGAEAVGDVVGEVPGVEGEAGGEAGERMSVFPWPVMDVELSIMMWIGDAGVVGESPGGFFPQLAAVVWEV